MESNYVYFDVTIIGIIQIECTDHDTSDCYKHSQLENC